MSRYAGLPLVTQGQPETSQRYIDALVLLAVQEGVDIFLPCSGAGSTVEDAQAAEILRKGNKKIRCFITSSELTRELHEKVRVFILCLDIE